MWALVWGVVMASGGALTNAPAGAQEKEAAGDTYKPAKPSDDQLAMGEKVYFKKCVWCHGPEGAGDGPGALRLWPRPRNFNQGTFKIRTTASGELPTDDDLFLTVTNGLPGSAMPAWDGILTEEQRRAVVAFVKTKLIQDRNFQDTEFEEFHILKLEGQVPSSSESIERGREVFNTTGKCVQCHGNEGRGNGNLTQKDDWGFPIFPANLHQCWNFRGNRRDAYNPANVFREVSTGLNGTPMPSFVDVLSVDQRWDVANFVISLCPKVKIDLMTMKPAINFVLGADYVEGPLPTTIEDPAWNVQEPHFVGLGGQITRKPQNFNRRHDSLWVKSLYNKEEVAFLVEWEDRTESHAEGANLPPPTNTADLTVPVAYYANKMVFNEVMPTVYPTNWKSLPQPVIYNDAVAIQFPAMWEKLVSPERPFFIHGDEKKPVDLWKWESDGKVTAYTGHGIEGKTGEDKIAARPTVLKAEAAQFKDGVWRVILKRSITTEDQASDVQFEVNKYIPIAFQAWDGDNGEAGAKMALSAWYYVVLKPLTPTKAYVYPFVAIIAMVGVQWWVIRKATSMQNGRGGKKK
jgi:DMSO reductase family type II enzyme heme b subunit